MVPKISGVNYERRALLTPFFPLRAMETAAGDIPSSAANSLAVMDMSETSLRTYYLYYKGCIGGSQGLQSKLECVKIGI